MSDFVFNVSKGAVRYYASLPGANDALICIPIEAAGIEADALLKDYADLPTLLAASNNEQTTMGRVLITETVVTQDDLYDRVDADFEDPTWTAAEGNDVAALIVCYDPDTTAGTDADLIMLTKHDWAASAIGLDLRAAVSASGFYRAE